MLARGRVPEIFVLTRVPPDRAWETEERRQIFFWRNISPDTLPIWYPPQTRKGIEVEIGRVDLMNVRDGG